MLARDAPAVQLTDAGSDQRVRGVGHVRPARIPGRSVGPEQEPADLADVPRCLSGAVVGEVAEQVGSGDDPVSLLSDQIHPLLHPGTFDELAGLPLQRAEQCTD